MNLSDDELRAMVRDAIARLHAEGGSDTRQPTADGHSAATRAHASHLRLTLVGGGDPDGACLIEPAVRCTHCGYCQSYGH